MPRVGRGRSEVSESEELCEVTREDRDSGGKGRNYGSGIRSVVGNGPGGSSGEGAGGGTRRGCRKKCIVGFTFGRAHRGDTLLDVRLQTITDINSSGV